MVVNLYNCDTVIAQLFWESVDVRFAQAKSLSPSQAKQSCLLSGIYCCLQPHMLS